MVLAQPFTMNFNELTINGPVGVILVPIAHFGGSVEDNVLHWESGSTKFTFYCYDSSMIIRTYL